MSGCTCDAIGDGACPEHGAAMAAQDARIAAECLARPCPGCRSLDGEHDFAETCTLAAELDRMPYVCPGCHAVGEERCAPGCIDAEIEAEAERDFNEGPLCMECGQHECFVHGDGDDEDAA